MNKKAQDLSIGTLILIVLGIIVLVLLILGFSYGWSNLWEKINIFGGKTSISDVVTNCNLAVTSNAVYTYCNEFKQVTIDNKKEYVNCEDPRVASGITTKIDCINIENTNYGSVTPAQDKCYNLIDSETANKDKKDVCEKVRVNNKFCKDSVDCTQIPAN